MGCGKSNSTGQQPKPPVQTLGPQHTSNATAKKPPTGEQAPVVVATTPPSQQPNAAPKTTTTQAPVEVAQPKPIAISEQKEEKESKDKKVPDIVINLVAPPQDDPVNERGSQPNIIERAEGSVEAKEEKQEPKTLELPKEPPIVTPDPREVLKSYGYDILPTFEHDSLPLREVFHHSFGGELTFNKKPNIVPLREKNIKPPVIILNTVPESGNRLMLPSDQAALNSRLTSKYPQIELPAFMARNKQTLSTFV